jgi:hypothetical protein
LNYFEKYKNFLNSVNKNSPFNNSCICVDFLPSQEEQAIVKALEHTYPHIPKEHIMTTVC